MNKKEVVKLNTYKYNSQGESLTGESKVININKAWLINEIKPLSLEEFLSSYTWDESELLYRKYHEKYI